MNHTVFNLWDQLLEWYSILITLVMSYPEGKFLGTFL